MPRIILCKATLKKWQLLCLRAEVPQNLIFLFTTLTATELKTPSLAHLLQLILAGSAFVICCLVVSLYVPITVIILSQSLFRNSIWLRTPGQANEILPKKDQVCKSMVIPDVEFCVFNQMIQN